MCLKSPGVGKCPTPGPVSNLLMPHTGLTRHANAPQLRGEGEGGWVQLELTDALTEMVGKNGMEIGCLLEEEFQKVNLYVLRETANCYLF